MMLLMAKVMKLSGSPGVKAYIRKISPFLDADEKEQLSMLLKESKTIAVMEP